MQQSGFGFILLPGLAPTQPRPQRRLLLTADQLVLNWTLWTEKTEECVAMGQWMHQVGNRKGIRAQVGQHFSHEGASGGREKLAKELLQKPELPEMFGKELTGGSSPGKEGSQIQSALRLASPPAPSPATWTSSVRAYISSHSPCLLHPPLQAFTTPCLQMPAKLLLLWLGASPAAPQPPAHSGNDSLLTSLQDFLLNSFIV